MINILITFLASFLIWLMFAGLLILWVTDGKIRKTQVIHALLVSILSWLIVELIKFLIPTARPFLNNGLALRTLTHPSDGAFPSVHSALAFGLATTIWLHDKKIGWLYLISAFVVGIARIWANVHYPVDVLGGALMGIFVSFMVDKVNVFKILKKRS